MEKHPLHIKISELQKSQVVEDSVSRQERLNSRALQTARELEEETGEPIDPELFNIKIPNDPTERINIFMDRMEKIFLNPDARVRTRNLKLLKPYIYDVFIIKPEEVPESYFELQQQVAREQGINAQEIPEDMRKQMIETVIKDQTHSLDNWIDYLSSEDAVYPT
jgi:8-oxo-dGTP pyrophosphatase MutT (NUDIX family)